MPLDNKKVVFYLTLPEFIWRSSNESVATVNKYGEVYAIRDGKTIITALANDSSGIEASFSVEVKQLVESINIIGPSVVVAGKSIQLNFDIVPSDASNKNYILNVPTVEGLKITKTGKVTTTKKTPLGKYTITVSSTDESGVVGKFDLFVTSEGVKEIVIEDKEDQNITLFRVDGTMDIPTSKMIFFRVNGENNNCYEAISSNPGVVGVTCSEFKDRPYAFIYSTGNATGKSVVTVRSTDGTNKCIKINITVKNPISKVIISPKSDKSNIVTIGKSLKLDANIENRYGKVNKPKVLWYVLGDSTGVSVNSNGLVNVSKNAWNHGHYNICAYAMDGSGVYGTYDITTVSPTTYIYLTNSSMNKIIKPGTIPGKFFKGKVYKIPVFSDSVLGTGNLKFSSSNPDIVSPYISISGGIYYLYFECGKAGRATITIYSSDLSKSVKYSVIVK